MKIHFTKNNESIFKKSKTKENVVEIIGETVETVN